MRLNDGWSRLRSGAWARADAKHHEKPGGCPSFTALRLLVLGTRAESASIALISRSRVGLRLWAPGEKGRQVLRVEQRQPVP